MRLKLNKAKLSMSRLWKFNVSLFDKKNFQDQLELMLKCYVSGGHKWEYWVSKD